MTPQRRGRFSPRVRHFAAAAPLVLGALAAIFVMAGAAIASGSTPAHVALRSSSPAANDTLTAPPESIRLDFTQAVEVPLSRIELLDADSMSVPLAPVRAADTTGRAIVANVPTTLKAGTYRVHWTVTSRDSHTIRGDFRFTVLAPVVDTTIAGAVANGDTVPATALREDTTAFDDAGEFDAHSPAYVAIRGISYLGMLGVIGALFFGLGVIPRVERITSSGNNGEIGALEQALSRARTGGVVACVVLLLANASRLVAQLRAVFGQVSFDSTTITPLLTGTAWGAGWIAQMCATVVALGIISRWRASRDGGVGLAAILGGLVLLTFGISAAISGHPAAASPVSLAVTSDAVHLMAVGGWLGTLAYVVFAGLPATSAAAPESRPRLAHDIVRTFSNMALVCVSALLVSGVLSAWLELRSVSVLWTTPYGRVLMLKLTLVAVVAALGAYNWRIATPRLAATGEVERIRTTMIAELAFAVLVLGATAFLTATPPPIDMG